MSGEISEDNAPCPQCGHGRNGGHSGGSCVAELYRENISKKEKGYPEWCSCEYNQRQPRCSECNHLAIGMACVEPNSVHAYEDCSCTAAIHAAQGEIDRSSQVTESEIEAIKRVLDKYCVGYDYNKEFPREIAEAARDARSK